jgi:hypothetical protein
LDHSGNWDIPRIDDLIRDFHDLSLLSANQLSRRGTQAISLHPLVAEWIRYRVGVTAELRLECLLQAFDLVKICLQALQDRTASQWVSSEMREEILKHEAACCKSKMELARQDTELASKINEATFISAPIVRHLRDDRNRQATFNVMSWLSAIEMQATHRSISERRLEGTCNWIFEYNQYLRWLHGDVDLLYCTGIRKSCCPFN